MPKLFIPLALVVLLAARLCLPTTAVYAQADSGRATEPMPDISGVAWVERDTFLAVHDAKNPEENHLPRVSLLRLPRSAEGVRWKPLDVAWGTPAAKSSDLESIARVPGTAMFLLFESGESSHNGRRFSRIFLAELGGERLTIRSATEFPHPVINVEGSAVLRLGDRLVFVWAERGDGQAGTNLSWADLQLAPFKLGTPRRVYFKPVGLNGRHWRPVSAIEIDERGRVYVASAYDPEDDGGPFASIIWRVGRVGVNRAGLVTLALFSAPRRLARLDGLKVEGLAIRERGRGVTELFAGADDENYGGALRQISIGDDTRSLNHPAADSEASPTGRPHPSRRPRHRGAFLAAPSAVIAPHSSS